jgi:hypothetical protein
MAITFYNRYGKGGVKGIKVEGDREKEKEIFVRHEFVFSKWKTWNYNNFTHDWNKHYSV